MVFEAHVVLCVTAGIFEKKYFCPKNVENGKIWFLRYDPKYPWPVILQNGCDQSCLSALKLAISQEGINDKLVFGVLIQSL